MRSARSGWQHACCFLVILSGLFWTATCLGLDPWPDNVGPHDSTPAGSWVCIVPVSDNGVCWPGTCDTRPADGSQNSTYTCGTTVWNYQQRLQYRQYGECGSGSTNCTYYDKYYCAQHAVYKRFTVDGCVEEECRDWIYHQNGCAP